MTILAMYQYLGRARRDLWAVLEGVPEERLAAIKKAVFHVAVVEDCWLHEDILRVAPVLDGFGDLDGTASLERLLEYWRAVEQKMLNYLKNLTDEELERVVEVHDAPTEHYKVDGLLWQIGRAHV